ncbi:response regulator transcription factor [bacterium]|nr:response regulator transcription factor [bacterium]MBU1994058.1 response regulator transcription factor [bacterium]
MHTKISTIGIKNKILKELKVLLVEDEEKLSSLLKKAIGDNFYAFYIANNGKEGMDKFLKLSPDVVITDIMMPEVTGLEMAKEIKKIDPSVPIIILSAFSETDKFLDAIDVGVVKYFIKPFDTDELLEYISSLSQTLGSRLISLVDGFSFNKTSKSLYKEGRYVALTKNESKFIQLLLEQHENQKNIVEDATIKNTLWMNEEVSDEKLRTFVRRVRAKTSKGLISNIKGQGYEIILA